MTLVCSRFRNSVVAIAVIVTVSFVVVRVEAGTPASLDRVDVFAVFSTTDGLTILSVADDRRPGGFDRFDVTVFGANFFRCGSFGADSLVPDITLQGRDTVGVSGTFDPGQFDFCVGSVPPVITLDLDLTAGAVVLQKSISTSTVLKGDPDFLPADSHTHMWLGSDVVVSGTVNGASSTTTSHSTFALQDNLDVVPAPTTSTTSTTPTTSTTTSTTLAPPPTTTIGATTTTTVPPTTTSTTLAPPPTTTIGTTTTTTIAP